MANPRNGLTNHIRTVLRAAGESLVQVHAVMAALADAGVVAEEKNVRSLLSQRTVVGEFRRDLVDNLAAYGVNPDFVSRHGKTSGPAGAAEDAGADDELELSLTQSFAGSIGLQCDTPAAATEGTLRQAIELLLVDGAESSLNEIQRELGRAWTRRQVLAAMSDGLLDGWLQSHDGPEGEASVYALAGDILTSAPKLAEAMPPMDPVHYAADAHELRTSLGLRDRVEAIASDIEDAIGDACDARLAHELIKALTVANGATQRALRQLAA